MLDIKQITEQRISEIWQEFSDLEMCKIPPLSVDEIDETGIVFIGINPSLSEDDRKHFFTNEEKAMGFYTLNTNGGENHKYFKKFADLSTKTSLPWCHFDLLYMRETRQSKLNDLMKFERGRHFIYHQLMVSKQIINQIMERNKSAIFVVNNALSRDLLGKDKPKGVAEHWMNFDFEFNHDWGTDSCNGHPFFFTCMLTGQSALDRGSYERLVWHINFVKEKLR
ncbi:MAG: hypothetical protein ACERKD_03055 [Prolixibacteraceae bacterium]